MGHFVRDALNVGHDGSTVQKGIVLKSIRNPNQFLHITKCRPTPIPGLQVQDVEPSNHRLVIDSSALQGHFKIRISFRIA